MALVSIHNLSKFYGADRIFSEVSFQVHAGDKVALVGVNGAGKSTILKIVAQIEQADAGAVSLASHTRMAYLAQQAQVPAELTLWQLMDSSLDELNTLREELSVLEQAISDVDAPDWQEQLERYGECSQRFELLGGYEIENTIEQILQGLGFTPAQYDQLLGSFSGGQKTRAALAATLLQHPDLLLLDEPTNHLDLAALEWLESFLKSWQGTVMVVSHDRYFLDAVTNRTIELANGTIDGDYPGGYNKYIVLRAERYERMMKEYEAQQAQLAKTEEYIRRFKAGSRATQARGRERRLERMKNGWQGVDGRVEQLINAPAEKKKLSFSLQSGSRGSENVLLLDDFKVGYPNKTLLNIPSLEIRKGQRVALMGANGCGKTTLIRTLLGEVPDLGGKMRLGGRVEISYYAQGHERLDSNATLLDELWRISPASKEVELRGLLGRFLFSGDDVFKKVGSLSGGERSRVALAQLMLLKGNLLILDEPTNHLDIDTVQALEDVLSDYDGTLLFVSHDRSFIDNVADTLWIAENGTIEAFLGTYSEYNLKRAA